MACGLALTVAATPALATDELPGTGITAQAIKSTIPEENFQTLIVMKALQRLGYTTPPIQEVDLGAVYLALGNGDADFFAVHWDPLHDDYYRKAGGDARQWRDNAFSVNALQGYLIDKKTADAHQITNLAQLRDPAIAGLFDADGDGKADMTGCNPGWGCEAVIEHQLDAYQLRDQVTHVQGNYATLMADTITRFRRGEPVLYYTWTPFWVSNVLIPGKDVVWLEVPFSSLPGEQARLDTQLPNGKNYGWTVNTMRIMAPRAWLDRNPAARTLFSVMKVPIADINAQNQAMHDGADKPADIERHADGWIRAHQELFDQWIEQAMAAR
ncbi:MAG TPA: glycine betaine/L-proline ABC transporter substrate-binding protein ProX [Ottowia sp.]|uniref:glycine betaine/L-proline ABC transporter substrate-binding protein ProX n=1 Tax=Ottowia sp. TaxID=1898956 RepID=UPI002D177EC0|nr:glycine betaine/L-proline ABC transporter substrate-binding protein ProX [Ottowia sp.]HMN21005.1 glycine betaine/L-proline ABC transporter substrate-binding protein ProX [Ottowia sp.]